MHITFSTKIFVYNAERVPKKKSPFFELFFRKTDFAQLSLAEGQKEGNLFVDAIPALGGDAGVIEIGMAEAFVQHSFRLRAGPGPQTVLPDKLFS